MKKQYIIFIGWLTNTEVPKDWETMTRWEDNTSMKRDKRGRIIKRYDKNNPKNFFNLLLIKMRSK